MKKTNKENPLTFFRKANEARQKNVRTSIKKAQDGIEMNDDLINKAGSTGGYKAPANRWSTDMMKESALNGAISNKERLAKVAADFLAPSRPNQSDYIKKAQIDSVTNKPKSNTPMMDSMYQRKKGGAVKGKKK